MSCSSCKYLNEKNKKDGSAGGCLYYCKKNNCYVNGCVNSCSSYSQSSCRKNYESNAIYEAGYHYSNDDRPVMLYVLILIMMLIFLLVINIF